MFSKGLGGKELHAYVSPQNLKLLLIINYAILLSALFFALTTPPASGYEFSIYNAYPDYFWCLVITSILLGFACSVLSVLSYSTSKYWLLGFLNAMIASCLFLFLPTIRGYFIYGSGDVLTHIGYMQDIEIHGSIGGNHYPILHILGFSLHDITGLPLGTVTMIIPPILSLISISYWYILGREMFDDKVGVLFLVILGSLPFLGVPHSLFAPNYQANLLIPLILYCLIKSQYTTNKREISAILITLSILIVPFHPLIAVIVMSIYVLLYVLNKLPISPSMSKYRTGNIWMVVSIMAIFFSIWSTYLYSLKHALEPLLSSILGNEAVESEITTKLNMVSAVDVDIIYLIKLSLMTYGFNIILGLGCLICIIYLLILRTKSEISIPRFLLSSMICFIAFFISGITIFFTMNDFGYERVYRIAKIFALIIISGSMAIACRRLQNLDNLKKITFCLISCTFVIMLIFLSLFTLHLSPVSKQSNQQVPLSDYYGMAKFFEYRDDSIWILEYGITQWRFYETIYGLSYPKVNIRFGQWHGEPLVPIDHFGYNTSSSFGFNYNGKRYFLLATQGKEMYENLFPEFPSKWRFIDEDFEKMRSDISVDQIYSNEYLMIYLINA
jgi:hypothetical protein